MRSVCPRLRGYEAARLRGCFEVGAKKESLHNGHQMHAYYYNRNTFAMHLALVHSCIWSLQGAQIVDWVNIVIPFL